MGSDYYLCECGETVDPKGTPHVCPRTPNDRLDSLERDILDLGSRMELKVLWVGVHDDGSAYVGESEKAARDYALDDDLVTRWLCAVDGDRATMICMAGSTVQINSVTPGIPQRERRTR